MELKKHFITTNRSYKEGTVEVFQQRILGENVSKAVLAITALGIYEAQLNGEKVGDYLFSPGYTYYPRNLHYDVYDVTSMITGDSVLTVYLGQGWYCGRFMHENKTQIYGDSPAVSWILTVEYEDGHTQQYYSDDDSVATVKSPYGYAGLYDGEIYYADGGPDEPAGILPYAGKLPETLQRSDIHVQIQEEVPVQSVTTHGQVTILDFGQNFAGIVEIDPVKMDSAMIKLRHGEILNSDGSLYTTNLRKAKAETVYYKGTTFEKYRPKFTYMGFRYVEISGCSYTEGLVSARVIHSQMRRTGFFTSENKMVERLYQNQIWSQRSNYVEVPTDCPQRDERMGYPGDGQAFAPTGAYNYDTEQFWAKFFRDIHFSQMDNSEGYVGPIIPAPGPAGIGFVNMLGWGNAVTILPEMIYRQYGEERYFAKLYDNMKSHVECEIRHMGGILGKKNLWIAPNLGDWLSPGRDIKYMAMHNGPVSNAFIVNDLRVISQAAQRLGHQEDADRYAQQLEKSRDAYIKAFVKKDGTMKDNYQGAYIMALQMVIPKGELWDKIFAKLVEKIKAEGMQTGFFSTAYLLPMLADNGHVRLAFDLLLQENCPGWMHQVKNGATTIWERWDSIRADGTVNDENQNGDNMVSFNHYAFGSVGRFYYEYILGIKPILPGFAKVQIQPFIDERIGAFSGSYHSRKGEIKVCYNGEILEISTPVDADIILPDGGYERVEAGTYCFAVK